MNLKQIKLFVVAVIALPILAIAFFKTNPATVGAVSLAADDDVAAVYKAKCAMCHKANAEKSYDPAIPEEEQIEIILKGKKGEKPPFMPGFESKGMTHDQAKELAEYMKKLRNPDAGNNADDAATPKEEAKQETEEKSREAIAAMYKSKCAACHSPKAEKFYDPAMKTEEQAHIILKGKKGEKPPFMPAFEEKGVTEKEAVALAAYMSELRTPSDK